MKWRTTEPVTGSVAVVMNDSGETGLVDVRWNETRPQLFGPVYNNRFDDSGNELHSDGLPVRDIVDPTPEF